MATYRKAKFHKNKRTFWVHCSTNDLLTPIYPSIKSKKDRTTPYLSPSFTPSLLSLPFASISLSMSLSLLISLSPPFISPLFLSLSLLPHRVLYLSRDLKNRYTAVSRLIGALRFACGFNINASVCHFDT